MIIIIIFYSDLAVQKNLFQSLSLFPRFFFSNSNHCIFQCQSLFPFWDARPLSYFLFSSLFLSFRMRACLLSTAAVPLIFEHSVRDRNSRWNRRINQSGEMQYEDVLQLSSAGSLKIYPCSFRYNLRFPESRYIFKKDVKFLWYCSFLFIHESFGFQALCEMITVFAGKMPMFFVENWSISFFIYWTLIWRRSLCTLRHIKYQMEFFKLKCVQN